MEDINPIGWLAWVYGRYFQNYPIVGGTIVVALFAAMGMILWMRAMDKYKEEHPTAQAETITSVPASPLIQGGRGGNARATNGGIALGGPGGSGSLYGSGGDGGNAESQGANSMAVGGAGGSMDGDTLWHPPAASGYEVARRAMGLPVDPKLRQYGRGGMSTGYRIRYEEVEKIRAAYFAKEHKTPETAADNIEAVPLDYINQKLSASGFDWKARIVTGPDYEFFVPQTTLHVPKPNP